MKVSAFQRPDTEQSRVGGAARRSTPDTHPTRPLPASQNMGGHVGWSWQNAFPIQTKLAIGFRDDEFEREADRVAREVVGMPDLRSRPACPCGGRCPRCATERSGQSSGRFQARHAGDENPAHSEAPPIIDGVLNSPGQPLEPATRGSMEPRLGHDFGAVRVHADARASESAQAIHALAYTAGHHVVFGAGQYSPNSHEGRRLLAHELAHVVQQDGCRDRLVQRQPDHRADEFAPKGPVAQAREDVGNALLTASRKLDRAIKNRDNNAPLPPDVFRAYDRFFKGSGLEKLDLLKTRVDEAGGWIQTMPFDIIPNPVPAGYRDEAIHRAGLAMPGLSAAAMQPPTSAGDIYIAIYPPFYADGSMQAPKVLHELFHFFPNVRHSVAPGPTEANWDNARAYQGFVGTLAGLTEGAGITTMFPP